MAVWARAGSIWAADTPGLAGVAVTADHVRQQIDGFGFCEAFHQAGVMRLLSEKDQTDLLNLMFSANGGMGYSILRSQIGDAPLNGPDKGAVATIEPKDGEFQWTRDENQIWLMNEAKKRGYSRFMASAWSSPAWMKTNNDKYAGELKPAMYQKYAEYLASYVLDV